MTLLDHSRAQERDAVAKTRPTTDSDTVVVRAPAGSLGVFLARDTSHRVTEVRASGPLAGRVAVGDRLVSIRTPGRALFTCGPTATGPDIVDELRAGAGSDGRVLTFARRGESALVSPFRGGLRAVAHASPSQPSCDGDGLQLGLPLFHRGSHSFHHE